MNCPKSTTSSNLQRKLLIRDDLMAVVAVRCEPLSVVQIPFNREKYRESDQLKRHRDSIRTSVYGHSGLVLLGPEQGIFRCVTGNNFPEAGIRIPASDSSSILAKRDCNLASLRIRSWSCQACWRSMRWQNGPIPALPKPLARKSSTAAHASCNFASERLIRHPGPLTDFRVSRKDVIAVQLERI